MFNQRSKQVEIQDDAADSNTLSSVSRSQCYKASYSDDVGG